MIRLARTLTTAFFLPFLILAAVWPTSRRALLIWGSTPLVSNKYWSEAMRRSGRRSMTIMEGFYPSQRRDDFDRYFADFVFRVIPQRWRTVIGAPLALMFALRHASVVHMSYDGFALGRTAFWRIEAWLLRLAGVKIIVMPYGADAYMYSRIIDPSLRYGLLASYPQLARLEGAITARVNYWNERADIVISGLMIDGNGRSDVTLNQFFAIDTDQWSPKPTYSQNDGTSGPVRVIHTPNHRGFKGTEFLVDAVARLKGEGLYIDLILLEGVPNERVRELMRDADILAEQFIATGYALSGIEGMASGLPVLANLDHEAYTRVFRRYGFLDECPVLSTTPETIADNLRILVSNPTLRRALGTASRAYVEKYHSFAMADYLFGSIYKSILAGDDVSLINLFHPLLSSYCNDTPKIEHPLRESRIPIDYPLTPSTSGRTA